MKQTAQPKPQRANQKSKKMAPQKSTKSAAAPKVQAPVATPPPKPQRTYWETYRMYILFFALALVAFFVCTFMMRRHIGIGKEEQILKIIQRLPDELRLPLALVTALGGTWAAAGAVTGAFVLRLYQLAWRLALSLFTAYGMLVLMKEFFARPRPFEMFSDIHMRIAETGFGFPSTHSTIATVLALTIRTYLPVPPLWQWVIVMGWIGGVVFSRLYLGVHSPLDVVAGVALGIGVVCFWRIIPVRLKSLLHLT